MALLVALATFLATICGGLFALHLKDKLHLILGFSAGAVIGVAFFDLLPEALQLGQAVYRPSTLIAATAAGFFLYLVLDQLILGRDHGGEDTLVRRSTAGAGSLSVHSFLDGMGIGLAFHVSAAVGAIVAAAVLTHDFSDGINTINFVLKSRGDRGKAIRWLMADALAPVLGVLATFFLAIPSAILGLSLALFAGFFLYIGAADLVPESHHAHPTYLTTLMTIFGAGFLYVIIRLAS